MTHTVFTSFLRFLVLAGLFLSNSAFATVVCIGKTGSTPSSNATNACVSYQGNVGGILTFNTVARGTEDSGFCTGTTMNMTTGAQVSNVPLGSYSCSCQALIRKEQILDGAPAPDRCVLGCVESIYTDADTFNYYKTSGEVCITDFLPPLTCASPLVLSPTGSCVAPTCPAGQTFVNGACSVPACVLPATLVNGVCTTVLTTCPTGQTMTNGVCTTSGTGTGTGSGTGTGTVTCSAGQTLVNNVCTSSGSVGGSCATGFTCTGEALQCAMAKSSLMSECRLDSLKSNAQGDALAQVGISALTEVVGAPGSGTGIPVNKVNISTAFNTANPYSASCPPDVDLFTYKNKTFKLPLSDKCQIFVSMGNILVVLATFAALLIVFKGV